MIRLGKYNELEVLRDTKSGLYLGDDEGNDVLLPGKYIPEGTKVGDKLEVFVYRDNEERAIATTMKPKVTLNQFGFLKVKTVTKFGAFLDWGIEKDLFVPYAEQPQKMQEGESYIVYLYLDEETDRLVGSANPKRFLYVDVLTVEEEEEVDVIIWESTGLGFSVIINHVHKGLVYHNEIFSKVQTGDFRKGYIKKIREDNKIDVVLQKQGYQNVEPNSDKIVEKLKAEKGFLPLTDNSSPDEIYGQLEMSKKTFKKAVGLLYKQRVIRLEKDGIYLN